MGDLASEGFRVFMMVVVEVQYCCPVSRVHVRRVWNLFKRSKNLRMHRFAPITTLLLLTYTATQMLPCWRHPETRQSKNHLTYRQSWPLDPHSLHAYLTAPIHTTASRNPLGQVHQIYTAVNRA